MSGIAYTARAVLYTSTGGEIGTPVTWYGTELSKVRVELTQGKNIRLTGLQEAAVCALKVHDGDLPKPYLPAPVWAAQDDKTASLTFDTARSFFIVTDKPDISADAAAPTGVILDDDYEGGLQEYLAQKYGYTYRVTSADHYSLIPHWEVSGR